MPSSGHKSYIDEVIQCMAQNVDFKIFTNIQRDLAFVSYTKLIITYCV